MKYYFLAKMWKNSGKVSYWASMIQLCAWIIKTSLLGAENTLYQLCELVF